MSVLLPNTTVRVLSRQQTVDGHGRSVTHGWTERGPFQATTTRASSSEQQTDTLRASYDLRIVLAPEAWPVSESDRLVDADDAVYEVTGANRFTDPSGTGRLDHVTCDVQRIVGAIT